MWGAGRGLAVASTKLSAHETQRPGHSQEGRPEQLELPTVLAACVHSQAAGRTLRRPHAPGMGQQQLLQRDCLAGWAAQPASHSHCKKLLLRKPHTFLVGQEFVAVLAVQLSRSTGAASGGGVLSAGGGQRRQRHSVRLQQLPDVGRAGGRDHRGDVQLRQVPAAAGWGGIV